MKNTVELMKPRVKLEIRYPHYPFDGDVLLVDEQGELYHETEGYPQSIYKILESDIQNCKCFRIMNWWEERKPEEMPEYVKEIGGEGHVVKVTDNYCVGMFEGELDGKYWEAPYIEYEPATETEYNTYKNNL